MSDRVLWFSIGLLSGVVLKGDIVRGFVNGLLGGTP